MKKILYKLVLIPISLLSLIGCINESIPTEYAIVGQKGNPTESELQALANSAAAFMYSYNYFQTLSSQEFGYPAMMIMRDALTDCPYVSSNYNHFSTPWGSLSDFTLNRSTQPWRYYYRMVLNANNTISAIAASDEITQLYQQFYGNALAYRALSYMDLMRMYEYKKTGIVSLDAEAESNKIFGLTTVIIDENFDTKNVYNNQRAPFYQMYRFIMSDLNRAEKYLQNYKRIDKTQADLSVIHALKARLWLEIATRFQKNPNDLQTQLAFESDNSMKMYDKLEIASTKDCYLKAAQYARSTIGSYTPLSESDWHSITNGFNNSDNKSWIFSINISSPDAVYSRTNCFHSNCVTEFSRGYSRSQYHCYRMIDKSLYDQINNSDWRKVTWIDPADAGKNPTPTKYHTLLDAKEWALRDAYVGFKFRPKGGDISSEYKNALQVHFPIIRIEEMYFIEAEAKTYTEGLASGISALSNFLNTYRYKDASYNISPNGIEDFVDNYLITEKRIELWGEGLSFFDIKRRNLAITRGYKGSNWLAANRYNSLQGYTASWLNFYIPNEGEVSLNNAAILNPDPAAKNHYGLWLE